MNEIRNLSRREFLRNIVSGTGLILGTYFIPALGRPESIPDAPVDQATFHPNIFLGLERDGTVFIVAHRSEMGNGSRTDLPRIVADELDADWNRVRIIQAIGDPRYGSQATDASSSVRGFFDLMREVGATARQMLIFAAAAKWSVPASECVTDLHAVIHPSTQRRLTYGELAPAASNLPVPRKEDVILKARTAWRYAASANNRNCRSLSRNASAASFSAVTCRPIT
jgi:isoquinoline 1-oxidoreductase subunit beta